MPTTEHQENPYMTMIQDVLVRGEKINRIMYVSMFRHIAESQVSFFLNVIYQKYLPIV